MRELLWMIPSAPYAGFILLALMGRFFRRQVTAAIGTSTVGLSMILTIIIGIDFISTPSGAYLQYLWGWMSVGGFMPWVALRLDALSMIFIFVIAFVGFLIHVYSAEFMAEEEGYSRFFAWMNLFVGSMLVIVLADNMLLLYLGWEGVGLCSYLLIGFWYKDPSNGRAARKAFVVTRVGDAAFAIGLIVLFSNLGTLSVGEMIQRASVQWAHGPRIAVAVAVLLLAGAVGKSAQLPLQVWLPDAMAGPTPVSALIHAATMVTAGVYLIARTSVLFMLVPQVMWLVCLIGAATMLVAGLSALFQTDIKRLLAYSTISQTGFMFLALGVGAWSAAVFHFMTHAFFKALLFLCAGAVMTALNNEHDIFRMGGLRRQLPLVYLAALAGASSLASLPVVTAGFYSKDLILLKVWSSPGGGTMLWTAGVLAALITSIYSFRFVFVVFHGEQLRTISRRPGPVMTFPLILLAIFSLSAGLLEMPETIGPVHLLSGFLGRALPETRAGETGMITELLVQLAAMAASLCGLAIAFVLYAVRRELPGLILGNRAAALAGRFIKSGWGFDWVYEHLFVAPFVWLGRMNRDDFLDLFFLGVAWSGRGLHRVLSMSQSGRVRWYAMGIGLGAAAILAAVILL